MCYHIKIEFKQMNSDFLSLVQKRQSVRKYISKPVDRKLIQKCVEAARLAPSACNSQPWTFVVVDDSELKNKVAKETMGVGRIFNKFVPQSEVIVAIVLERAKWYSEIGGKIKDKEYVLMDIGIAAEHFCLQAAELNLGTCMLGWFNEKEVAELLQIPEPKRIPLLITLGYEPENYKQRKKSRKSLKSIMSYNQYGDKKGF